jgi:hypothetical protein
MTWVITIWSLLGLYIILFAVTDNPSKGCKGDQTCTSLASIGEGFAVAVFMVIWLIGFLALSIAWVATRPTKTCPHCWENVNSRRTTCKRCGYDFTNATALAAPAVRKSLPDDEPPFWPPPPNWKPTSTQSDEWGRAPEGTDT